MRIYTSCFANIQRLPEGIIPISISLYPPKGYMGFRYQKLAPTPAILRAWQENHDTAAYKSAYEREVLSRLDAKALADNLERFFGGKDVCLVCFEKSDAFCHRHLVSAWFADAGIPCEEWRPEEQQMSLF